MASVTDAIKAVFVGLNDNVQSAPMEDNAKMAMTTTIGQLFVLIDLVAGIMHNMGVMASEKQRMEEDIKGVMHSTGMVQGAVETLVKQSEVKKSGGGGYNNRSVLESKAVANMKTLSSDKGSFRAWHEKLVNVMEQLRSGSRGMFKALTKYVDQEIEDNFIEWVKRQDECSHLDDEFYDKINEDIYVLLMDKCEAEALTRVRSCPAGEGLMAYRALYKWFMGVSGQAISDRVRRLMSPVTPKHEYEIADHLDKWIEAMRTMEGMKEEFKLQDPFKLIALEQIMAVGQARLFFENVKIAGGNFEDIYVKCKDYATRRRIEHGHKRGRDDMEVDVVNTKRAYVMEANYDNDWALGGEDPWEDNDPWDMDYFNKGKGKGKGDKGKGKGAPWINQWASPWNNKGKAKGKGDKGK